MFKVIVFFFRAIKRGKTISSGTLQKNIDCNIWEMPGVGGGGGGGKGMLVVSLRGVNFGFSSRLGCSGQNAIICSRECLL